MEEAPLTHRLRAKTTPERRADEAPADTPVKQEEDPGRKRKAEHEALAVSVEPDEAAGPEQHEAKAQAKASKTEKPAADPRPFVDRPARERPSSLRTPSQALTKASIVLNAPNLFYT